MSRKNQAPGRWTLPEVVNPPDSVCFQIPVPNDKFHIAAFLGAIFDLAKPYKWANDPGHTAIQVGAVWLKIFEDLRRGCPTSDNNFGISTDEDIMSQLRLNPDNPCIIQMWCIDHWEDWYDPTDCGPGSVVQPGPGGEIPGGTCRTYSALINANSRWRLPSPVNDGYTITVTDTGGMWTDGAVHWYCPDGTYNVLGICGAGSELDGPDPIPTVNHMRLIGFDGTNYIDLMAGPYTVPAGTGPIDFMLQANDSTLGDNGGSITAKIEVCATNVADSYCYEWNFLTGDGGFVLEVSGGNNLGVYVGGTGWQTVNFIANDNQATIDTPVSGDVFEVSAVINVAGTIGSPAHLDLEVNGVVVATMAPTAGDNTITWHGSPSVGVVTISAFNRTAGATPWTIKSARVRGLNPNPFSLGNPC